MSEVTDELRGVADAVAAIPGLEPLPCDGQGHPIEDALACLHVRCTLPSPAREELLAQVGPLVRRAQFVMAALIGRRDLYSLGFRPPRRDADLAAAAAKLSELLRDADARASGIVPDRRGR